MKKYAWILVAALVAPASAFATGIQNLDCTGRGPGYLGPNMTYDVTLKDGTLKVADYLDENNGSSIALKPISTWKDGNVQALGTPGSIEIYVLDKNTATLKQAQYDTEGNKKDIPLYIQLTCK